MTRDWIYTSFNGSTLILTSGTPGNSQVALNIFEMLHNVAKNICMLIVYCNKKAFIRTAAAAAKSLQSCLTLCDPIDRSPRGCPVPGILQARTLEWVAISFSNARKWSESEVAQSCPTLSDPMDCSPPGSFVHGIFQARVLEWVAIAFSTPSY